MDRIPVVWHPAYDVLSKLPWTMRVSAKAIAATPVAKYAVVREQLGADDGYEFLRGRYATDQELFLVHSRKYVHDVKALAGCGTVRATFDILRGRGPLDKDCVPFGPEALSFFIAACGGTLVAAEVALRKGVAFNLAGGFHHARRASGHGFCVFNDVAIAAKAFGLRVLVVDADVHQGDGTATLLANNPNFYTLSFHQEKGYPEPRAESTVDIEMPIGQEDGDYLAAFKKYVRQAVRKHAPELIIYLAGADPLETDKLGGLCLTLTGLARRDRLLFECARDNKIPVATVMAGGYSDLNTTVMAHLQTFREAEGVYCGKIDLHSTPSAALRKRIARTKQEARARPKRGLPTSGSARARR